MNKKKLWFIPLGIAGVSLMIAVIMVLWNWLMPEVFGLKEIGFWQAAGLLLLSKILFGASYHSGKSCKHHHKGFDHHNRMHDKWMHMSEEERNAFIHKRMSHFHSHHFSGCKKENDQAADENNKQD